MKKIILTLIAIVVLSNGAWFYQYQIQQNQIAEERNQTQDTRKRLSAMLDESFAARMEDLKEAQKLQFQIERLRIINASAEDAIASNAKVIERYEATPKVDYFNRAMQLQAAQTERMKAEAMKEAADAARFRNYINPEVRVNVR